MLLQIVFQHVPSIDPLAIDLLHAVGGDEDGGSEPGG